LGVIKRNAEILGLSKLDVLIEDTSFESTYFQVLECPSILTQGKSSFLIGGSSKLKAGIEVKIELVNNDTGEVIYNEPVRGHLEGNLRRVSFEVYDDTIPGSYTLYIVGELNPDEVNVPAEWQNVYNVRWSKSITVNGMGVNTQPILFYKQPTLTASELISGFIQIPSGSATIVYLTGSGEPRTGLSPVIPVENATGGGFGTSTYPELDFANKAKLSIIEENKPIVKLSGKHGLIGSQGQQVQTMSPVLNDYIITVSGDSTVSSLYVGHNITINNPQVDTSKFTLQEYHEVPSTYSSTVMKVLNNTSFVPKDVFYIHDNRTSPATLEPAPLASTYPISASYLALQTQTTSSINLLSFADMQISDMRTFSGDVHKLKIYAKSEGSLGDFELIYDAPAESFQVLYDKTADTLLTNMGYFLDSTRLNNYWEAYQGNNGNTSGTLTYNATYVNDSMKISGSNKEYGDTLRVQNKTAVDFIKGTLYSFRAKVYGIKKDKKDIDGNTSLKASFKVMAYGDAFNKEETTGANWGDEKLSIPDMPGAVNEYDFGIVEGSFLADNTDTGYIQFKVDSGEWYVSDISLKAATDTAFNPDYLRLKSPIPALLERPDRIRFLVEFYDVNNNMADSVIFTEPFDFDGPNMTIQGLNNILSGSMFLGNALYSGIEMAGVDSAYVRSIGYLGFLSGSGGGDNPDGVNSGFVIWSGSILPDSGDDYKGVGLELVGHSGSYFRFRTEPSELDIRANAFFVGSETSQFISGSGGNIEISSSNFHVSSSGDVTMTGTITAEAGNIGDWQIIDGKLSGSNATLDAVGAALYHTSKGPGSDSPPGGFHQLRDEYYIDFTPSEGPTATAGKYYVKFGPNFSVSESGVLFASGAVFEGTITASAGLIGGWSIEPTYIGSVPDGLRLYGNSSDSSYHISSSDFQVTTTGQITASAGKIGGWDISSTRIQDAGKDLRLTSTNPKITIGTHTIGDGPGIQLGYDGSDVLTFFAGQSASDYIKYTAGTGIDIKTANFKLDTSTFDVDTAAGGTIKLGSSPGMSANGIFLSGSGEFNLQVDSNNYLKADGSSFTIKSQDFVLSGSSTLILDTTKLAFDDGTAGVASAASRTAGKGVFMNTDGEFRAGTAGGNRITFSGSLLEIVTDNLNIDTSTFDVSTDNGGTLSLGTLTSLNTNTTNYGVYMSGSGASLIKATSTANKDYLLFNSSGLQVRVADIDITTTGTNKIKIDSTGGGHADTETPVIALGGTFNTNVGGTNKGIFMDASGSFLLRGSATNYFKFDASAESIDIKSDTFDLATTQMILDSATNSGKIALGSTPPTAYNSGNGIYMDGEARFLIGSASGDHLQFDGNNFDVQVGNLEVAATNIQISSTKASMSLGGVPGAAANIILDGANNQIQIGADSDRQVIIEGSSTQGKIYTGKTSAASTTAGFWLANNNEDPEFHVGNATDFLKFDGGNLDIQSQRLEISASTIQISSTQASMSLGHSSTYPRGKIILKGTGTPTFTAGTDADWISMSTGSGVYIDGDGKFRFGDDDGNVSFDGTSFSITGSDVDINVTDINITATGFQLSSTEASMSLGTNHQWKVSGNAANPYMSIGMGGSGSFGTAGLWLAHNDTLNRPQVSFVGSNSHFKLNDNIDIDTQTFELDANDGDLQISSAQKSMSLNDQTIVLDGANAKIMVGPDATKRVTIQGGANDNYIVMGDKEDFTDFDQSTQGIIIGMESTIPKFEFAGSATNYISYDGSNFDIKLSQGLELAATNIQLSSAQASMSLGGVPGALANITLDGANSKIQVGATGSNSITLQGGTFDNYIVMGDKNTGVGFAAEGEATGGILIGMDANNPQAEFVKSSTNYFIFDGTTGVDIKTTNLEIDAGDGDLQLSSTHKSMSLGDGKVILQGASEPYMVLNSGSNSITLKAETTDAYMVMGSKENFDDYDKSTAGIIIGMDTSIPKFEMVKSGDDYLRWDSTDGLDLRTTKMEVSASNIQISSTQASMSIGDPTSTGGAVVLQADGDDKMIRFGTKVTFDQDIVDGLIMGINASDNKPELDFTIGTSNDQYVRMTSDGIFMKVPNFELDTATFDISSANKRLSVFKSAASGSQEVVRLGEISEAAGDLYGLKIYDGTQATYSDDGHPNTLVMFGEQGNKIGGWEITNGQIRSIPDAGFGGQFAEGETGLILQASGSIETSDFVTGLKGWRISSLGNGTAEFENARIRGTLRTTVFEKESINVVGGQLMVANSTTLEALKDASGSIVAGIPSMSAADVTMSVANTSGFRAGEILKTKKINNTGFSVEYMLITGSLRYSEAGSPYSESIRLADMGAVDPDGLAGELYVGRGLGQVVVTGSVVGTLSVAMDEYATTMSVSTGTGYANQSILKIDDERMKVTSHSTAGGITVVRDFHDTVSASHAQTTNVHVIDTDKEFLAGLVSTPETYNEGQVIVSTGVYAPDEDISSGYILMNANPNDISTPYMDIVERTGSGVYDLQLRTRLGDLSGLSSAYLYGDEEPGFGLYTENGFFKGAIHAMTGSIHGILHVATLQGGIETGAKISIGRNVSGTQDGIHINNNNYWFTDAEWRVGDGTNYLHLTGSGGNLGNDLRVNLEKLELNAGGGDFKISSTQKSMSFGDGDIEFQSVSATQARGHIGASTSNRIYISGSTNEGYIYSGKPTYSSTTAGFWLGQSSNTAKFNIGDSTDFIKFSGTAISMSARSFELDAGGGDLILTSTHKSMSLGDGRIKLVGQSSPYIQVGNADDYSIKIATDGTDQYIAMGGKMSSGSGFAAEGAATGGILIGMDNENPQAEFVSDDLQTYFIFDGDSGLDVKTTAFELAANDDDLQISSTQKSMSLASGKILLDGGGNYGYVRVGGSVSAAGAIHISGSTTTGIIRAGKTSSTDTVQAGFVLEKTATDSSFYVGDSNDGNYVKFATAGSAGLDIKTQKFELDAGPGDLQISSTKASMSLAGGNILLDGSGNVGYAKFGSAPIIYDNLIISSSNTTQVLKAGISSSYALAVANDEEGFILERGIESTKFHLGSSTEYIRFDGTNIDLSAANFNLTASNVNIVAGDGMEVDAPDFEISTLHKSMSLGYTTNTAYGVVMVGGSDSYLSFGPRTSPNFQLYSAGETTNYLQIGGKSFGDTTAGIILGENSGVEQFEIYKDADEYFRFSTGPGGLDIRTLSMSLVTPGLTIHGVETLGASNYIAMGSATTVDAGEGFWADGGGSFRIGTATSGTSFMYFKSDSEELKVKTTNIDISTTNLDIVASGSSAYIRGDDGGHTGTFSERGFILSSSGYFSFQTADGETGDYIRSDGTMAMKSSNLQITGSTTFLLHGNSGGAKIRMGATAANITKTSNAGVYMDDGGFFRVGTGTGGTDYIYFDPDASSLQITAETYSLETTGLDIDSTVPSIVLDGATARVVTGDVSSVTDTGNFGVWLQGDGKFLFASGSGDYIQNNGEGLVIKSSDMDITATEFSLTGGSTIYITEGDGGKIALGGTATSMGLTSTGVFLSGSGYFNLQKDSSNYIRQDGSGLQIVANDGFNLSSTDGLKDLVLNTSKFLFDSSSTASGSVTRGAGTGVYMDNTGAFRAGVGGGNSIDFDGSTTLTITSNVFSLDATSIYMDSAAVAGAGMIGLATDGSAVTFGSTGVYMDGTGKFSAGISAGYGILWDGSKLQVSASEFYFGDATNYISGSGGAIDIAADTFDLTTTNLIITDASQVAVTNKIVISGTDQHIKVGTGVSLDGDGDSGAGSITVGGNVTLNGSSDSTMSGWTIGSTGILYGTGASSGGSDSPLNIQFHPNSSEAGSFFYYWGDGSTTPNAYLAGLSLTWHATNNAGHIVMGQVASSTTDIKDNFYGIQMMNHSGKEYFCLSADASTGAGSTVYNRIAGWQFDDTTIESANSKVILDSTADGKIRMGATPPASATSGTGIFLGGDGDFLAGSSDGNHLQYLSEGTIDIQSTVFSLDATTVIIDSSAADGKIQLGPSGGPGSATGVANAGAYLDGTGKFNFGDGTGNYIRFNATGLEVNTDNLTIDSAGDVEITGNITVTNTGDFASSTFYYPFGGFGTQVIDTGVWNKIGNITETPTATGIGFEDTANDGDWDSSVRSVQGFLRADSPRLEWDFKILKTGSSNNNYEIFGWTEDNTNGNHTTTAYGIYVSVGTIYWRTHSSAGSDDSISSGAVSDVWRLRITLKSGGGAFGELFKNGDYTTPFDTYDWGSTGSETTLYVGTNFRDSGTPRIEHQSVSVGSPLSTGTVISGTGISTGAIQSTNWDANNGSKYNLDDGSIQLGGSSAPTFEVNSSGNMTLKGSITSEATITGGTIQTTGGKVQLNTNEDFDEDITTVTGTTFTIEDGTAQTALIETGTQSSTYHEVGTSGTEFPVDTNVNGRFTINFSQESQFQIFVQRENTVAGGVYTNIDSFWTLTTNTDTPSEEYFYSFSVSSTTGLKYRIHFQWNEALGGSGQGGGGQGAS